MTQPVITLPVVWQSNISIKVWEIFCSNTHLKDYNVLDFLYFKAINPTSLKWVRTCHPLLFSHCLRHGFCFESEDVMGIGLIVVLDFQYKLFEWYSWQINARLVRCFSTVCWVCCFQPATTQWLWSWVQESRFKIQYC